MDLIVTIVIGVGIGVMVELLLPGHTPSELVLAVVLGVAGSVLARYIGELGGWYGTSEPASFIASGVGAVVVLLVYGTLFRRGHRH
jgi:uncharacterized membrane protein YeaQ/YmgE (transglycosylase-associated protein family)